MHVLRTAARCLLLTATVLIATPAAAQEPNAYPITDVNLRAGPGTEYPVILTVPADAPITILGCLPDYTWCDSVFENNRGWMRSIYLSGYYEGDYYLLRDYAPDLGYQQVTFSIDAYWDSYYRDAPFYRDRGRWERPHGEGYVDEGVFYDRLAPHGAWTWIQGRYVWVPARVERDWRPYTRGRWVYTNRGWTWVSNEPFGWATYHYGRWGYSDRVGWFWVPGNRWAPAWVSWRQSDDYLAWAPLAPEPEPGISINVSFGNVPDYYWSMVPSRDFLSDDLRRYYVHDRGRRRAAFDRTRPVGHTKIVNKTIVNNVVNVNYIEQKTKTKVVERQIAATDNAEAAGKVEGDTLEVYEPKPDEAPGSAAPPDPKEVKDVAAASETKGQAEGEATTEEMLAPEEVRKAAKARKGGKGRKADAKADTKADAKGEAGAPGALPEGDLADAPPPAAKKGQEKPVPAHEVAAPKGKEPQPEAETGPVPGAKPDAEPAPAAEDEAKPAEPGPAPEATGPEPPAGPSEQAAPKPDPDAEQKPAPGKDGGKPKKDRPAGENGPGGKSGSGGKIGPGGKGPPGEIGEESPPAPKPETPRQEKPAEVETPEPGPAPKAQEPEAKSEPAAPKAPEAKAPAAPEPGASGPPAAAAPEPKAPEAKPPEPQPEPPAAAKPPAPKPEAKEPAPKPEAKKPGPKPEAQKPGPKPEAKEPAPKPEAKKPGPKPEAKTPGPKPEAKKPGPKPEAKKPAPKPEAKKPAGPKPQAKKKPGPKPQAKKPGPKPQAKKPGPKPEAKRPGKPPGAKARTAQGPERQATPSKGKKNGKRKK